MIKDYLQENNMLNMFKKNDINKKIYVIQKAATNKKSKLAWEIIN